MKTAWILIPLLIGSVALAYTVIANLVRVWMNHRVKLALLERLQADPDRRENLPDLERIVNGTDATPAAGRFIDHVVTGVSLALLGIASALAAWLGGGQGWMAGAYLGGVLCVTVGFILTLLGLMLRYLARLPIQSPRK